MENKRASAIWGLGSTSSFQPRPKFAPSLPTSDEAETASRSEMTTFPAFGLPTVSENEETETQRGSGLPKAGHIWVSGHRGGGVGVWRGAEVGEGSYVLGPLPAFPIRSRFPGEETEPVLGL